MHCDTNTKTILFQAYGNAVRRDHRLFFEAFRNEKIPILNEYQAKTEDHPVPCISQNGH